MKFTSTRDNTLSVDFFQAVKQSFPADGGVFIPATSSIEDLRRWIYYIDETTSFTSIAGALSSAFMRDEFSPIICQTIAESAFPFSPIVRQLDDNLFHMELFHGYTGCHRDFGVSYLCSYLETTSSLNGGNSVFIDYTNGELGALLSQVLRGKKHIKAVLVYRKGTVRGLSESDYVWNGGNILPVEMEGTEGEIKAAISELLKDKAFSEKHNLMLANTTNVCRLMAQVFYFPYAFAQIKGKVHGDINYALDSGNYAALMAGLYSWRFALPVNGFYLPATAELGVDAAGYATILDSMISLGQRDSANPVRPANLERLEAFFADNKLMMRNFVFPCPVSERKREKAAKELFMKYGVFADPGTASAYATVKANSAELADEDGTVILVSQNHPSLSGDYCRHVLGEVPVMPENIKASLKPVQLGRPLADGPQALRKLVESI